jgi:hypothetical protein
MDSWDNNRWDLCLMPQTTTMTGHALYNPFSETDVGDGLWQIYGMMVYHVNFWFMNLTSLDDRKCTNQIGAQDIQFKKRNLLAKSLGYPLLVKKIAHTKYKIEESSWKIMLVLRDEYQIFGQQIYQI